MDFVVVMITVGNAEEARQIADALLAERLVACVNQVPGVTSEYWWKGCRETASEILLLAKTRRELWPEVLERIRAFHSYEVFGAVALPIVEGNPDYLAWVEEETAMRQP